MSQKNSLIFLVVSLLFFASLGVYSFNIKSQKIEVSNSLEKLFTDIEKYQSIKHLDKDKKALQASMDELKKRVPSIIVSFRGDSALIQSEDISKTMLDRVIQTIVKRGHLIESFEVKKSARGLSLHVEVKA